MAELDTMVSNEELASRFQGGDDRAFVELAGRMMPMLRFEAAHIYCNGADDDDLVQEAMMALLTAARRYRAHGGASFATFCRVCVKNRLLNAAKSLQTPESPQEDEQLYSAVDRDDHLHNSGFEDRYDDRENDAALLSRLKATLSPLEYRVMILHLAAYTYQEIALSLHVSPKSVDNAMQRIRRKLSAIL